MNKNYNLNVLFSLLFVLIATVVQSQTTQVSVFNYPNLNGTGGCGDENENLIGIIDALPGYDVDGSITSFSDATLLASQLEESTFFFMTDMERESPGNTTFFPVASHAVFENWVDNGGVMVMTGTAGDFDNIFLNLIFGWDLGRATNSSWAKTRQTLLVLHLMMFRLHHSLV